MADVTRINGYDIKDEVAREMLSRQFELIETITLTEDVASIERTQEPDGTPYNFKKVTVMGKGTDSISGQTRVLHVTLDNGNVFAAAVMSASNTAQRGWWYDVFDLCGFYEVATYQPASSSSNTYYSLATSLRDKHQYIAENNPIVGLKILQGSADFNSGTEIKIYAVR